jgi:hypothetical protein
MTSPLPLEQLIAVTGIVNGLLAGALIGIVYLGNSRSQTAGGLSGLLFGLAVVLTERYIGIYYLEFSTYVEARQVIVAAGIGAVVGATVTATILWDPLNIWQPFVGYLRERLSSSDSEGASSEGHSDTGRPADRLSESPTGEKSVNSHQEDVADVAGAESSTPSDMSRRARAVKKVRHALAGVKMRIRYILARIPLIGRFVEFEEEKDERIPIDELQGEELEQVIEYLNAIDEEADTEHIEQAAYQLRQAQEDARMVSSLENLEERSRLDRSVVAPQRVEEQPEWHTRDGEFYQILTVTALPRHVGAGWLVPLTLSSEDVKVSYHVEPKSTENVKSKVQRRLTQVQSAIQHKAEKSRSDVQEEEYEREELERLLKDLIEGKTKLFDVAIYIEVRADSREALRESVERIQRRTAEQGLELTPVESRQSEAQQAIAPVGKDPILNRNTVQLEALATFFSAVEPAIDMEGGICFGFDNTNRPVIINRFGLSGHSKAVSGKIGGGKSYSVKMALYRRLMSDHNLRSICFDPQGDDFVHFAQKLGGEVIQFGGEHRINPLEIGPQWKQLDTKENPYQVKVRNVIEILKTYLHQKDDPMSAGEEGIISVAIHYAYLKKGITMDPATFDNESPIMDDVIEGIEILKDGGIEEDNLRTLIPDAAVPDGGSVESSVEEAVSTLSNPPTEYIELARQLQPKFESFKPGNINANLNGHTNISLDSRIVVFDMSSFSDTGEMPLIMHAMLSWAFGEARRSDLRTDVTFEEAHYLLRRDGALNLINLFIRHSRHMGAGLTLISQTAEEFLRNDDTREIYDNCDVKQLFYQEHVNQPVIDYFDLSDSEADFIQSATMGEDAEFSECLLHTSQHGQRQIEIWTGGYEHHILEDQADPWRWLAENDLLTQDDMEYLRDRGVDPADIRSGEATVIGGDSHNVEHSPEQPGEIGAESAVSGSQEADAGTDNDDVSTASDSMHDYRGD